MTDFLTTYRLTRQRFDDLVRSFPEQHFHHRIVAETLTMAEMAMHVAGVEIYVITSLLVRETNEWEKRMIGCAFNGVVNNNPFPFSESEMTRESMLNALDEARKLTESVMSSGDDSIRRREIKSVLGPMIDGDGAMARLCAHPFYHQGQGYLILQLVAG
ncbi:MAG: hypothetical protein J0L72_02320 [Armatimonadetes bacterium]|nr:hypothetical protein [Armatimonadota bacterium]